MSKVLRIGTRESQLAVWQANSVKNLLAQQGCQPELVFVKSEGDIDVQTPLYEMGVQGIFTKSLDVALLNKRIDLAVHSMKDVPTQMAQGIAQAAVLKRGSYKDLLVYKTAGNSTFNIQHSTITVATSSIRRKAQWLHRYPNHTIENLRGNVNTRLKKLDESHWHGAIFAAAGLERIGLRPSNSIEIDWMLPAPAQGAIVVVCREDDSESLMLCKHLNDEQTALCTHIEKQFLRTLLGGCSTPISALAEVKNGAVVFKGNIFSVDGKEKAEIEKTVSTNEAMNLGETAAHELLANGGKAIAEVIHNER